MSQEFRWNSPLKVINAPLRKQILSLLCSQNVLPFVLPFAYAIGKLQVFRGFFGREWCGREERTIQVFLRTASDSILRVASNATRCPTICHNRQYARHVPLRVTQRVCATETVGRSQKGVSRRSKRRGVAPATRRVPPESGQPMSLTGRSRGGHGKQGLGTDR